MQCGLWPGNDNVPIRSPGRCTWDMGLWSWRSELGTLRLPNALTSFVEMKIATMQLYFSSLTHNILRDIREHSHNATNTLEQVCLIRCDVMLSQLILFFCLFFTHLQNEMKWNVGCWFFCHGSSRCYVVGGRHPQFSICLTWRRTMLSPPLFCSIYF